MPNDEGTLRVHALAAIGRGILPKESADRIWAGPGVGAPCSVCNVAITDDEMEFETQFKGDAHNGQLFLACRLHVRCFAAWEFERF